MRNLPGIGRRGTPPLAWLLSSLVLAAAILTSASREAFGDAPGDGPAPASALTVRLRFTGIAKDSGAVLPAIGGFQHLPLPLAMRPAGLPIYKPGPGDASGASSAVAAYRSLRLDYTTRIQRYTPAGDYLNFGLHDPFPGLVRALAQTPTASLTDAVISLDSGGIPIVSYGAGWYHNPATIAQYALGLHGKYVAKAGTLAPFLKQAAFLTTMQDNSGAIRYPFSYPYYLTGEVIAAGWTSALAQGQALSVFSRAFAITGEERYETAGEAALAWLLRDQASGGNRASLTALDRGLSKFMTLEEYPSSPSYLTLNGFMFTMLGLYDWWQLEPEATAGGPAVARDAFESAMATLVYTLPYFDINGMSAYDLGHVISGRAPNVQAQYHLLHIALLHALNSVAPHADLAAFEAAWRKRVDAPPTSMK